MAFLDEKNDSSREVAVELTPKAQSEAGSDKPDQFVEPSEADLKQLRRIASKIPSAVWIVALFSGLERFAFYAVQSPLREWRRLIPRDSSDQKRFHRELHSESRKQFWPSRCARTGPTCSHSAQLCFIVPLLHNPNICRCNRRFPLGSVQDNFDLFLVSAGVYELNDLMLIT